MRPEERDAAHLWDMLQAVKEVEVMMDDHELAAFLENIILVRALERCIEIIGEAAKRVSPSFMHSHPQIPWSEIIGQRNILAHEYGQIDYEMLYKTAVNDIPELIALIENFLPPLDEKS